MITQFCGITPLTGFVKETVGSMQLYVNGSTGDDNNDGLSPAAPKKTWQAVFDLLPFIGRHNCTINAAGIFDEQPGVTLEKYVAPLVNLVIDGGDSLTIVDDNGGSNYTITTSSTKTVSVAGAGWTVDAHKGLLIEILSGTQAGRIRMIQKSTADTLDFVRAFGGDPGVGSTFRIVRYATTIQSDTVMSYLLLSNFGGGFVHFQRMSILGSNAYVRWYGDSTYVYVRSCTILGTYPYSPLSAEASSNIQTSGNYIDPVTYNPVNTDWTGVSVPNASTKFTSCRSCNCLSLNTHEFEMYNSTLVRITHGARITGGAKISAVYVANPTLNHIDNGPSAYATTKISNPSGVGLSVESCNGLRIGNIDISDCGSHAIGVKNSQISLVEATGGSGNVGAGVRAQLGSCMTIADGSPPTLTGTIGDLSFDGTTQASTWAAIDAGTPASDTTEMSMCKEE